MLAMAAFKLGDPMSLVVLMKSDDTFLHVLNEPLSSAVAILAASKYSPKAGELVDADR
mgnify:CR=1 FL=1